MANITMERDKVSKLLGVERKKNAVLTIQRDQVQKKVAVLTAQRDHAQGKVDGLIGCIDGRSKCRECGQGFGIRVVDNGANLIVRCQNCRTRHW